jgi:ABC-type tungstate transport system substrate-binding protein
VWAAAWTSGGAIRVVSHRTPIGPWGPPPVVVGLAVTLMLWRIGPLGSLRLLYTAN